MAVRRNIASAECRAQAGQFDRDDGHAGRHGGCSNNLQFTIVCGFELNSRRGRSATLRPTEHTKLGSGANLHLACRVHDSHGVDGVGAVDRVLVDTRGSQALVVSSDNNPVFVNELLQAGDAVVDLCERSGSEVGREFTRRVGARRRGSSITNRRRSVTPRHNLAVCASGGGRNHQTG